MPSPIPPCIILASSSRYRQELLSRLHIRFESIAPDIDETPLENEPSPATALRLACEKAKAVALRAPDAVIIGSDQVATLNGKHIGKPGSHPAALRQLQQLRGRQAFFDTALCLLDGRAHAAADKMQSTIVRSTVTFRDLPDEELDAYLRIEQPYDCAGSAKNEGLGIVLLESIESTDPTALTGLPLIALTSMLRRAGIGFFRNE